MGFDLPPPMGLRMATIICAVIPIVVVYPFIQPFFTSGMTLGAGDIQSAGNDHDQEPANEIQVPVEHIGGDQAAGEEEVEPLWYCVVASVMPYEEYVKGGMMLWFKGFDLQYYIQIFGTRAYVVADIHHVAVVVVPVNDRDEQPHRRHHAPAEGHDHPEEGIQPFFTSGMTLGAVKE